MPANQLKTLTQQRGRVKAALTRFQNNIQLLEQGTIDVDTVQSMLEDFKLNNKKFDEVQSAIESLNEAEEFVDNEVRAEFEQMYHKLVGKASKLLSRSKTPHSESSLNQRPNQRLRVPKIELPFFNGAYDKWTSFHNTFSSLIHSNAEMTDIEKLYYLKTALQDSAKDLVQALEMSDENYLVAWNLLLDRYDNKRVIIKNHVRAIREMPNITRESYTELRKLVDTIQVHLRSLKALKRPVDSWDDLLIDIITSKLDNGTNRAWESTLTTNEPPNMAEIMSFLNRRCHMLESLSRKGRDSATPVTSKVHKASVNVAVKAASCFKCGKNHSLFECELFLKLDVKQRLAQARAQKLCLNCLRGNHATFKCKLPKCEKCGKKHHESLHLYEEKEIAPAAQPQATAPQPVSSNHATQESNAHHVLLSTAFVHVKDPNGEIHVCRALLDSGSQSNFITRATVEKLCLPEIEVNYPIVGIGQNRSTINRMATVCIKSRINEYSATLQCLVMDKITENLPLIPLNKAYFDIPKNITLADPDFNISDKIDMLIGAGLFWELTCVGQIKQISGLILQKTQLGWIASGNIALPITAFQNKRTLSLHTATIEDRLQRFWELEECSDASAYTPEEIACEEFFKNTLKRDSTGRFIVKLPFRPNVDVKLGTSKPAALQRFYAIERKLQRNASLKEQYVAFMEEYMSLNHMQVVTDELPGENFYLPHHAVVKEASITTKLRVFFDASCKSSSGKSLNDMLMTGPVIQGDLFSTLTRFRKHQYVITADITKMYRQIRVDDSHTCYQRILWRSTPEDDIKTYELKTVTYGTAPASFLAIRCLHQLSMEHGAACPVGSSVIARDFYVDDLLTGANTKEQTLQIRDEVRAVLAAGGFELRKWAANDPSLLKEIPVEDDASVLILDKDENVKTLGLQWDSKRDVFQFSIPQFNAANKITKRIIISEISQVFDPLGLVNPVVVSVKIMIQKLWQLKLGWDESVPSEIHTKWSQYRNQISSLSELHIPRNLLSAEAVRIEIHGFCDASEAAYGACIYMYSIDRSGNQQTRLVCSKLRVAPLKAISLPRLELSGALLLAKLMSKVLSCLEIKVHNICYWTDSMIVLGWLNAPSRQWSVFVANRVSKIQTLTDVKQWRHIQTNCNPADILSRGTTPQLLMSSPLWWKGPELLLDKQDNHNASCVLPQELPEARKCTNLATTTVADVINLEHFSSFSHLIRVVAYCTRFVKNCRRKKRERVRGVLTHDELDFATKKLAKLVQKSVFRQELANLQQGKVLDTKSSLLCLSPFLGDDGIIRAGGRLKNSTLPFAARHPIILPSRHHFTELIIRYEHVKQLHSGVEGTLAAVRSKFWILSARNAVRKIIRSCIVCFRTKPTSSVQLMGNLPKARIQATRPFQKCGIDYFGPLTVKQSNRRNSPTQKAYGVVFVCFATKAVHCELVTDLTTETFISALKRFMSRRGRVTDIYSDNATNFVGANRELKELKDAYCSQTHRDKINNAFAQDGTNWHFIPANSPHFGGLWEAAVKQFKVHIKRIAGNAVLRYEELYTLITQIEALLNSRPISRMSDDPNDLSYLSPGHFLIGDYLTATPEPLLEELPINRLARWQVVERLRQHFWRRWHREYLMELQRRSKWKATKGASLCIGDLVLIRDDNEPPLKWTTGRVIEVHPGSDGIVRAASVKTASGVFKRAAQRLCILPIS